MPPKGNIVREEQDQVRETAAEGEPLAAFAEPEAAFALGTLDAVVGLHVGFANSAIVKHFLQTLSPLGLTPKQTSILWLINENPDIAKADLARLLKVERATMQAMVNSLSERGLIVSRPAETDGRRVRMALSEEGVRILAEAQDAVARHEAWIRAKFSEAEMDLVVRLMQRIYR